MSEEQLLKENIIIYKTKDNEIVLRADIEHYQKIIVALVATERLMGEVDILDFIKVKL